VLAGGGPVAGRVDSANAMPQTLRTALRARLAPALAVPLTIATGLAARVWLSGLPAKVAGDALYTVLVYVLVLLVSPATRPLRAFAIALGVSVAVELFQLTPYPAWLSSKHVLLRLVFGTTFGFVDIAGYVVGALGAVAMHSLAHARRLTRGHALD
jgi:hypothetical protein